MRTLLGTLSTALCLLLVAPPGPARGDGTSTPDLSAAARAAGTVNGLCPVMGHPVKPRGGSAVYRGEKVGFCCPGCIRKFQRETARYMDAMRADPARYAYTTGGPSASDLRAAATAAGTANGLCPVLEKPVTKEAGSVEVGGQRIGFCGADCAATFRADPQGFLRKMRADPVAFAYARPGPTEAEMRAARSEAGTVNGLCPVCDRIVTREAGTAEFEGERVGFSSAECREKFASGPEAFVAKMRAEPAPYGYVPPFR